MSVRTVDVGHSAAGRPARRHLPRYALERRVLPYIFISPFFILFAVFSLFPLVQALYYSTMKWTGGSDMTFIGLRNYINLFDDPVFIQAVSNTAYYAIGAVFVIQPIALMLALVVNSQLVRLKSFFRVGVILPNLTSAVAAAIMFMLMFDHSYGLFNQGLLALGLPPAKWLDQDLVKFSVLLVAAWRYVGINMLYWLAGLQSIPGEVYEAAAVDGANSWTQFWHITLPLLRPVALFVLVITIIGTFQLFAEPSVLAGGGPKNASLTIAMYIYRAGFQFSRMGYASAMGYVLAAMIFALSLAQVRLFGSRADGK